MVLADGSEYHARTIVSNHRDETRRKPQGLQVAQHIPGAAERARLAFDPEHRNRRLRRDPLHAAIDVMVQHDIADADQACRPKLLDEGNQVRIGHAPLIGRRQPPWQEKPRRAAIENGPTRRRREVKVAVTKEALFGEGGVR